MDNIIEIKNLNKSFRRGKIEQKVLENLHIEIKDMENEAQNVFRIADSYYQWKDPDGHSFSDMTAENLYKGIYSYIW